jgi:hypothetical protein
MVSVSHNSAEIEFLILITIDYRLLTIDYLAIEIAQKAHKIHKKGNSEQKSAGSIHRVLKLLGL